jgi:hypothetical protein
VTGSFWLSLLGGSMAPLPVFVLGLWFSHRSLRRQFEAKTDQQTEVIGALTAAQTAAIGTITAQQTEQLRETWPPEA